MRKLLLGASTAALLALTAACGETAPPPPAAAPAVNDQDVTFAQEMITHHQGAIDMAKLVPSRTQNPKIRDLATRIEQAQDPEIAEFRALLKKWGKEEASAGHGGGHGSSALAPLENAAGADFDRKWTELMIEHHQGAVDMSTAELAKGASPEAKALAQKIIDAQQAEITEMRGLRQS